MPIRRVHSHEPKASSAAAEQAMPPSDQSRRRIRSAAQPTPSTADGDHNAGASEKYKVGKGKPPLHSRFRKGQSGNPNGRPPGAKGLKKLVRENLLTKVSARTTDGIKRITRIEAVVHKQLELAMKGDQRAVSQLLNLYAAAVPDQPEHEARGSARSSSATDDAILAHYREQLMRDGGEAP